MDTMEWNMVEEANMEDRGSWAQSDSFWESGGILNGVVSAAKLYGIFVFVLISAKKESL